MQKNVRAALSYLIGPITGIIFYLTDKDPDVKYHASQSIVIFGAIMVLDMVLMATIILLPLVSIINLVGFILWLVLILKAYKGEKWEVPLLGKYVAIARVKIFGK